MTELMKRIRKVWGWTTLLYADPTLEIHKIEVEPGGFCSIHRHMSRDNMFVMTEGELWVGEGGKDEDWIATKSPSHEYRLSSDPTGIGENNSCIVYAGDYSWHMFHNLSARPCALYEIYTPAKGRTTILPEDIERLTEGGKHEST